MEEIVLSIGNFDGCHRGHQKLIKITKELALNKNSQPAILTFSPHPSIFFNNNTNFLLFNPAQKLQAIESLGFKLYTEKFDLNFSQLNRENFYQYLKNKYHLRGLVLGKNFTFAHQRLGNTNWLQKRAAIDDLETILVNEEQNKAELIGSTNIRQNLREGNTEKAAELLGRPYLVLGKIIKGKQKGRQLNTPTLNFAQVQQLIPKPGVYAGYVCIEPKEFMDIDPAAVAAVINISDSLLVETHALNTNLGNCYGKTAGTYFLKRLRDEKNFKNDQELKAQIHLDKQQALKTIGSFAAGEITQRKLNSAQE